MTGGGGGGGGTNSEDLQVKMYFELTITAPRCDASLFLFKYLNNRTMMHCVFASRIKYFQSISNITMYCHVTYLQRYIQADSVVSLLSESEHCIFTAGKRRDGQPRGP